MQKMALGEPDASGRRSPVPVEGSEYTIDADVVVVAVGFLPTDCSELRERIGNFT